MIEYPIGTIFIEIRGVYDGWSAAKLPDGAFVNRWPPDDPRYKTTKEWIKRMTWQEFVDGE